MADYLKGLSKSLIEATRLVMEKKHTEPKTEKEKDLAALAAPHDKITHKDVLVGRGVVKKEEAEVEADGEQIDELSKGTLASYAKKALDDAPEQDRRGKAMSDLAGDEAKRGDREGAQHFGKMAAKAYTRGANRRAGVKTAIDKLAKESMEEYDTIIIDEDFGVGDILDISESFVEVMFEHGIEKLPNEFVVEEVEDLQELSKETMTKYRQAAKKDPAFEKRKGKVSAARKAVQAKRNKGMEMADKKIDAKHAEERAALEKAHHENIAHVRANIHKVLEKHGFQKMTSHEKRDTYAKANHETGHVITATVHHAGSQPSSGHEPQVLSLSNSSGWQSSDDRHYVRQHPSRDGSDWRRDWTRAQTKKEALDAVHAHIKKYQDSMNARSDHMYESVEEEQGEMISELRRGRPPKNAVAAKDEEPAALGYQLRKAASINKPVHFMNGEKKEVTGAHINAFNDHMAARKTAAEKAAFQKQAHASHDAFVKAVTQKVPSASKDTGEIVKYR